MAVDNSDISLLFGVQGGAVFAEGSSGALIKKQLESIISEINRKPLEIKVKIVPESGGSGKKSWSSRIQDELDRISKSEKFSVQISSLKLSPDAVNSFRKQLADIANTAGLSAGANITITSDGVGEIKSQLQDIRHEFEETAAAAQDAGKKLSGEATLQDAAETYKAQIDALNEVNGSIQESIKEVGNAGGLDDDGNYVSKITDQYSRLADKIREVSDAKTNMPNDTWESIKAEKEANGLSEIKKQLQAVRQEFVETAAAAQTAGKKLSVEATLQDAAGTYETQIAALNKVKDSIQKSLKTVGDAKGLDDGENRIAKITEQYSRWADKIEKVANAKAALPKGSWETIMAEGDAIRHNIDAMVEEKKKKEELIAYQKKRNAALKAGLMLLSQMQKAERDWTAAENGKSKGSYLEIQSGIEHLKSYQRQLEGNQITVEEFRERLSELQISFRESSNAIKENGENTKKWGDRLGGLAQKFSAWLGVSQMIMLGVRSVRRMVTETIALDDAMTQLKIVTRDTDAAYTKYLDTISKTAARIGSTIPDLIDSTTTYARLGYSLEESSTLAEFTAMLQNVGDIDVADAQDALTAIVKAFGISVDEVESIMDKLVATGNNFPISVSQIAEGMNNASSALAAAGNSFDQSVALLTAANTTIQNAAKSSTGLRTIAARLRSTKTELDELGETMTEAEYGDLVAALTKYNVALTDAVGNFRSTYDIVADIAAKWDDLNSTEQAALANAIAGVRQQSVFYSMVEQFQEASGAMDAMANSAGTLESSYATFMESVSAHINKFNAAFQSFASSTASTDLINGFIDAGTKALEIIEKITSALGLLGTGSLALLGKGIYDFVQTAGKPKIEGFTVIVPAYIPAATRNEPAA